jgi:hypothetical protein
MTEKIGYKILHGSYKGATETSYIVNAKYFNTLGSWGVFNDQESILVLGPIAWARGPRPATLWFQNSVTRAPVNLGYFVATPYEDAIRQDAWTYDKSTDTYYTCKHSRNIGENDHG